MSCIALSLHDGGYHIVQSGKGKDHVGVVRPFVGIPSTQLTMENNVSYSFLA